MSKTAVARIVVEKTTFRFDKPFDYKIPESLLEFCLVGCRVTVPFGRSNSKRQGLIIERFESENEDCSKYKDILSVVDKQPILNDEMILIVRWLKEHTFCTYYDAVHTLIPFGLNLKLVPLLTLENNIPCEKIASLSETAGKVYAYIRKKGGTADRKAVAGYLNISPDDVCFSELLEKGIVLSDSQVKQNMKDPTVNMVRLSDNYIGTEKLTPKQNNVIDFLNENGEATVKEVCYYTGVTTAVINTLVKKNLLELYTEKVLDRLPKSEQKDPEEIVLTNEQQKAFDGILNDLKSSFGKTDLLYGVTGSGKTSIFLKLVDETVKSGKNAIVMVPEISLTPQTLAKFRLRYGENVAVFHSAMSVGKRMEQYNLVKQGKSSVAIGTRSAVFAPMSNIGLIIMDEEQEHTYKSEQSPRFHARDVAKLRAKYHGALLLLASATPSVESFSLAKSGKYGIYTLKQRYGNAVLPEVITVDMRDEMNVGNTGIFSRLLIEKMQNTFENGNQVILLLNRRGHNTYVSCPACGKVMTCPNCSISYTYHSANKRLMCHYCGNSLPVFNECPDCKNKTLRYTGAGTQRADAELEALFPNKKILRLDADTTMARNSFEKGLSAFANGEYDILLGTQMVAKGLDFPNVTLVGVLSADRTMYSDDFRAYERTFSLLTQVIGRSGRGKTPGIAIVQTSAPDNEIINYASQQNYDGFFNDEIMTRKLMIYPPYCDILMVVISSPDKQLTFSAAQKFFEIITEKLEKFSPKIKMIILGPTVANVPRVNQKYRARLLIKTKNNAHLRKFMDESLSAFYDNTDKNVNVFVDINPESIV